MNIPNPLPPKGLHAAILLGDQFRRRLVGLARKRLLLPGLFDRSRNVIMRFDGLFQRLYRESWLFSWLKAAKRWARSIFLPNTETKVIEQLPNSYRTLAEESFFRWPQVEAAAESLAERQVLTPSDFFILDAEARRQAFTVARVQTVDALKTIQKTLTDHVATGGALRQFRETLADNIEITLSPAQIENVYRSHVGAAYSAGQRRILANPIVGNEFPYVLYTAIHDARTRHDHLALEKAGIGRTSIYRRTDPVIMEFWPPWDFNCRCHVIPLSIEDAARHKCPEAIQWLRTGIEPTPPAFVAHPGFHPSAAWLAEHPTRIAA